MFQKRVSHNAVTSSSKTISMSFKVKGLTIGNKKIKINFNF